MKTFDDPPTVPIQAFRLVAHPGDAAPARGAYRCLCCGVVLWQVQKGRRLPDCPSPNCPTMWLWYPRGLPGSHT